MSLKVQNFLILDTRHIPMIDDDMPVCYFTKVQIKQRNVGINF